MNNLLGPIIGIIISLIFLYIFRANIILFIIHLVVLILGFNRILRFNANFVKEIVEDIRKSLEGGMSLSKCFEKYPEQFDNVYVNLIKAGEASGKLDVFLLKIVDSLEKKEKIKKKIKSALMYPAIMFTVAITVSAFMLVKVVPVFAKMYDGMGLELPAATATIMAMSDFLRGTGGKVILFGGIIFYFGFNYTIKKMQL